MWGLCFFMNHSCCGCLLLELFFSANVPTIIYLSKVFLRNMKTEWINCNRNNFTFYIRINVFLSKNSRHSTPLRENSPFLKIVLNLTWINSNIQNKNVVNMCCCSKPAPTPSQGSVKMHGPWF